MVLTGKRAESVCAVPQWLGTARHSLLVVDVMSATPSVSPDTCNAYIYPEDAFLLKYRVFVPVSSMKHLCCRYRHAIKN